MAKHVQDHRPPVTKEARAWLKEEVEDQERRYQAIVKEQEALTSEREKWYAEFLHIVQTRGFNVTGDMRRPISKEEVPEKPDRNNAMQVVW